MTLAVKGRRAAGVRGAGSTGCQGKAQQVANSREGERLLYGEPLSITPGLGAGSPMAGDQRARSQATAAQAPRWKAVDPTVGRFCGLLALMLAALTAMLFAAPVLGQDVDGPSVEESQKPAVPGGRIQLHVRPGQFTFDVGRASVPYPPPPGWPVPIYVPPTHPPQPLVVRVRVPPDVSWELWVRGSGEADGWPAPSAMAIAPQGTPSPAPGTGEPPWPWLVLSDEPRLLASGRGEAELAFDLRLRLFGDEEAVDRARLTLTFTLTSMW